MATADAARRVPWDAAAVGAALVVTAALTLPFLDRSLWLDEAFSFWISESFESVRADSNMSLYYGLLALWKGFGTSEWALRSLSVVFALATVPALYALARQLLGRPAARVAVLLLAISPMFLQYAQEARSYSLLVFLATTSTWLFVRSIDTGRWRYWLAYAVVSALGIYAHFFAAPVLGVHAASVLLLRHRPRPWTTLAFVFAGIVGLCVPLLLLAAFDPSRTSWLQAPGLRGLFRAFSALAGGKLLLLVVSAPIAWGLRAEWRAHRRGSDSRRAWAIGLLLLWLLGPIFAVWTFSEVVRPIFNARYLIICLPPLVLLAANGIARLPNGSARVVAIVALVAATLPSFERTHRTRADWKRATAYVLAEARAGDAVVFYPHNGRVPFDYYLLRAVDAAPDLALQTEQEPDRIDAADARVWLMLSRIRGSKKDPTSRRAKAWSLRDGFSRDRDELHERKLRGVRVVLYDAPRRAPSEGVAAP